MPLQATSGAASYDAFGGGVPVVPAYIEEVFSTYLYAGTGSSQTITNNIDLSTKGGLVWIKSRSAATDHRLTDTVRGATKSIASNSTAAEITESTGLTAFGTTGFTIGADADYNTNAATYASWTFREQPKFFDIVTYTGNGTSGRTVAHNLGSTPGCVMIKTTSASQNWLVYHRSLAGGIQTANPCNVMYLNGTDASLNQGSGPTNANATSITLSDNWENSNGVSYVMYLFAHDAGGFGLTGTDNVISCGSFTSSSIGLATVDLGYEPQWILYKGSNGVTNWQIVDNMRGFVVGAANSGTSFLNANTSAAEGTSPPVGITNTGFNFDGAANITYVYIAIRRGPMKVPTVGTSVFSPNIATGNGVSNTLTTNFPVDLSIDKLRNAAGGTWFIDRLRGGTQYLTSTTTAAEGTYGSNLIGFGSNTSIVDANNGMGTNDYVDWAFRRAPSFFDEVCYTGTGSVLSLTHNLTVAPEFILIKSRSDSSYWIIGSNFGASTYALKDDWGYNASNASRAYSSTVGFNAQPTATTVSLSTNSALNVSASTYVMYMWATCAGVSKVGTYTGTGALQTINCGFTSGARFVLITRIGVVGDVNTYVYDSARGISSGNDPYLLLETTAAEVTGTNYVDTTSTGFQVTAAAPAGLNASGGSYIFLAIA